MQNPEAGADVGVGQAELDNLCLGCPFAPLARLTGILPDPSGFQPASTGLGFLATGFEPTARKQASLPLHIQRLICHISPAWQHE